MPKVGSQAPRSQVDATADTYRQARKARRLELVEDYVELVADLLEETGEARQVDIAQRLGVAQPTVAKMLKRLAGMDLIVQRPYRGVFLTESGRTLAETSRSRHQIVEEFLRSVGVSPETARLDAEGIEHHASDETLGVFKAFVARSQRGGARRKPAAAKTVAAKTVAAKTVAAKTVAAKTAAAKSAAAKAAEAH